MVVLADGNLDAHESQLMRRLAGLLFVDDVESGLAARRARHRLGLAGQRFVRYTKGANPAPDDIIWIDGFGQYEEIGKHMTYIVNDNCINCKYTDCVEVCPVDCFYEGENMLVIHPDECIDCGVCEPECPPEAILPDSEAEAEKWLELNREMSEIWPNIGQKIDAMPDAEKMQDETGKYEKYFSNAPGAGGQADTHFAKR